MKNKNPLQFRPVVLKVVHIDSQSQGSIGPSKGSNGNH